MLRQSNYEYTSNPSEDLGVTQQLRDDPNNIKTLGELLRDMPKDTKGDEKVVRHRVPDCDLG